MTVKSPFKRILWATDFSVDSCAALRVAHAFSKAFAAPLTGLHVIPDFSPVLTELHGGAEAEMTGKLERAREDAAARLNESCAAQGVKPDRAVIKEGSEAKTIIAAAAADKADLIVIGRRGGAGDGMGSVCNQVLRSSTVPVLVVPGGPAPAKIDRILVPTDFSAEEDLERDWAVRLAEGLGSSLLFLYVLELYGHEFRMVDEMLDAAVAKLRARVRRRGDAIDIAEDVYRAHNAADGIVDYAKEKGFPLIVMSTHVNPLARFFLGSTTTKVVSRTTVPVFAIPRHHA